MGLHARRAQQEATVSLDACGVTFAESMFLTLLLRVDRQTSLRVVRRRRCLCGSADFFAPLLVIAPGAWRLGLHPNKKHGT